VRIALILVEGRHDAEFMKKLLAAYGAEAQEVDLSRIYDFVRLASTTASEVETAITTYAQRGGLGRACRAVAALTKYVTRSRDLRWIELDTAIVSDENRSRNRAMKIFSNALSNELPTDQYLINTIEESRYLIAYVVENRRLHTRAVLTMALIECSLECQIAKHALGDHGSFCNPPQCSEIVKKCRNSIEDLIDKLIQSLMRCEEEWFRSLIRALKYVGVLRL